MKRKGNTVLITGGGSGIGLALAAIFLNEDNEVIICGRTKKTLDDAKKAFPNLHTLVADVSTIAGRETLNATIVTHFPKLNVLVNNAGIYSMTDIMDPQYLQVLETELNVNLIAPIALVRQLMPVLETQSEATIINVTTGYVFIPSAKASAYSASKVALRAFTQSLRFKKRNTNIRVVEVVPPAVDTPMNKGKNASVIDVNQFANKVFEQVIKGEEEILIGVSKLGKLLSRVAPKFSFNKMNNDEAMQRV